MPKTKIKERPILFSAEMVNAILAKKKSNTRRIIKPQPQGELGTNFALSQRYFQQKLSERKVSDLGCGLFSYDRDWFVKCPYGIVGDKLWVKETFFAFGKWTKNGFTKTGKQSYKFIDLTGKTNAASTKNYIYAATDPKPMYLGTQATKESGGAMWWKRPAIFMPRVASRITLDITDLQAERVQGISESDAIAEGMPKPDHYYCDESGGAFGHRCKSSETFFKELWIEINGEDSWNRNDWVWVIGFENK